MAGFADFRLTMDGDDLRGDLDVDPPTTLDITARVRPRLLSLSLTEKRGGEADQLELTLDDADGRLALPRKGAVLRLQLGWRRGDDVPLGLVDKGAFKVDEVEWTEGAPDQVRITARAADLTAGFRIRRERGWTGTTLGAIARAVAAGAGLTAVVAPELDGLAVPVLAQHQQSDMALLRRLGREHDAVATVKSGRLILSPIGRGRSPGGQALPALIIVKGDGSGGAYREIDRTADAGVEARWHDRAGATRRTVKVGGGTGTPHRLRRVYHSEADARAAAGAEAGRKARAEAEFDYTLALGRPDLYPERPVTLRGFKPAADAQAWLIAELSHTLDGQGGLSTKIKLETKGPA